MGRRLILDTDILIAYERGTIDRSSLDDDELAIALVSVAEYRVGIELADTASRAAERARALVAIMSAVDVLDYTQATAAHHGRLLAHVRRSGSPRAGHDLIIAAHAAETGRMILSRDAKARFGDLPGVSAIDVLHPHTEVVGHQQLAAAHRAGLERMTTGPCITAMLSLAPACVLSLVENFPDCPDSLKAPRSTPWPAESPP